MTRYAVIVPHGDEVVVDAAEPADAAMQAIDSGKLLDPQPGLGVRLFVVDADALHHFSVGVVPNDDVKAIDRGESHESEVRR